MATLHIDVFSDVVCPWCYIGEARFADAQQRLANPAPGDPRVDLDVRLRAFQLDPTADPNKTEPVLDAYARKFGGVDRARNLIGQVTAVAADVGLDLHLDRALRANTLRAHRLIWWASQPESGVGAETMNDRIMAAYFTDGLNIADLDTLADLAADVGGDRAAALAMLNSDEGAASVEADIALAAAWGVTAVPTVVVNEQFQIPGAQDTQQLVRLLTRISEHHR